MSFPSDRCLVWVINLERDSDRLAKIAADLESFGMPWRRFPAIDGQKPAELDRQRIPVVRHPAWRRWHQPLRRGEAASLLSHLAVAEALLETDYDYALVLEDDAVPLQGACEVITEAVDQASAGGGPAWDVLRLERTERRKARIVVGHLPSGRRLVDYLRQPSGTTAYLLNRGGAERMLAAAESIDRPPDIFLTFPWETGIRCLGVAPPVFVSRGDPSSIDGVEARSVQKISERPRAWLRKLIFSLPRKVARTSWNLERFGLGGWVRIHLAAVAGREAQRTFKPPPRHGPE